MARKRAPLAIGDRVGYSVRFLRSVGCTTGETPHLRGTVRELVPEFAGGCARVEWDYNPGHYSLILEGNLAKVGSLAFCEEV